MLRLIASIYFKRHKLYPRHTMIHKEYDKEARTKKPIIMGFFIALNINIKHYLTISHQNKGLARRNYHSLRQLHR